MKIKWNQIAWRNIDDKIDFYQTPRWCTEKLLERENFSGSILEPCSGAGAISKMLEGKWFVVNSQDIRTDESVYWEKWLDFFLDNTNTDNIITNPPYFCAKDFIVKALSVSNKKVAMLLKLCFLESVDRYEFFRNTPLKKVYVFCKRITMYPEWAEVPKNSGTIAYAWYIWEKWYTWQPTIDWII